MTFLSSLPHPCQDLTRRCYLPFFWSGSILSVSGSGGGLLEGVLDSKKVRAALFIFTTTSSYAAFFSCLAFAHLARCAAAIFLRPAADIVRFATTPFDDVAFAHRAFCARLIFLRADADRVRRGFV